MTAFDGFGVQVSVSFDSDGTEIDIGTDNDCVSLQPRDVRILIADLQTAMTLRGVPWEVTKKDYDDVLAEARERAEEAERQRIAHERRIAEQEAPDRRLGF